MSHRHAWFSAALLAAGLALTACAPKGDAASRVEPTRTTRAERDSARVLPTALIEFSDQASQRVAQDIAQIPEVRDAEGRVTVLVGDINNQTRIVSSSDFEMMRSRMRNNLLQSRVVKDRVRFVERRARLAAIRDRELVGPDTGNAEPPNYDAATTYALNGDFYRVDRGNTNLYYMEFQLVHFGSNEIVFSDRYEMKQVEMDKR